MYGSAVARRRDGGGGSGSGSGGASGGASVETVAQVAIPEEAEQVGGFSWRKLWAFSGPGWLMSIAYLDPGNLESDLQAGGQTNYQLIGVVFWATAAGLLLQVLAARLGVVTGKNLAQVCRREYPRPASLTLWVMMEIAIIGSDIQEVLGSAIAFRILFGWPLWLGCLVTGLDTFTFLFIHVYGIRKLELFFVSLIAVMAVSFFATFSMTAPDVGLMAQGLVNEIDEYAVEQGVGIVGAIMMAHNVFLHSALVQSRRVDRGDAAKVREANMYNAVESAMALLLSFLINMCIVAVFAKGFFAPECATLKPTAMACIPEFADVADIGELPCQTAGGQPGRCSMIGLADAGASLEALLGNSAKYVWAIGLLAAGQSATMTGTFAGQYVMEGFLQLKIAPWKRVALTRGIALGPAVTVAVLTQHDPGLSDRLGEWLNVLQSVQLPFALLPVVHFTSSERIMGQFANGALTRAVMWLLCLLIVLANGYLLSGTVAEAAAGGVGYLLGLAALGVAYVGFLVYLVWDDVGGVLGLGGGVGIGGERSALLGQTSST